MAAKIYKPPKAVGAVPDFALVVNGGRDGYLQYTRQCEEWTDKLVKWAKATGNGDLAGEEIRFLVGDGYAKYVVWKLRPLSLIHVPLGDSWVFQYDYLLTVQAVRDEVRRNKAVTRIFSKAAPATKPEPHP